MPVLEWNRGNDAPSRWNICRIASALVRLPIVAILVLLASQTLALYSQDEFTPKSPIEIEFNRDIRPILSDRCFACHGPDKNTREGGLRLDTAIGLLGDLGTTGAVAPFKADESELLRRLESSDDDERMPPLDSKKVVSKQEIDLVRRWIEQGASWQGHWAFEPIRRVDPPQIDFGNFKRDDPLRRFNEQAIDRFVIASVLEKNLQVAPPADGRILARRLHLDLLGLPPTNERVEKFVADYSRNPAAYEELVDELLASPHFGERMAIWWLDLVRYADTVGYHGDQNVSISPFRDYVIKAFNDNKPFNDFAREQIAGDLLVEPTTEDLIASGYNRLGMMSAEGGVQDKEYLSKYIAERVRNLGGAWLGVTLGCCECHDHKFDPFAQRDFYSFEAFFADIEEKGLYSGANDTGVWGQSIKVPTDSQQVELTRLDEQIRVAQARFETDTPELLAERKAMTDQVAHWITMVPTGSRSVGGATLLTKDDASVLASGANPDTDIYVLEFSAVPAGTTALRLEVLPDDSLPGRGPGRASNGNFVLSEIAISVVSDSNAELSTRIPIHSATATFEQPEPTGGHPYGKFAIESVFDEDKKSDTWGWAVAGKTGEMNRAVFQLTEPLTLAVGSRLQIELRQNFKQNVKHTLGRFRFDATTGHSPISATLDPPRDIELLTSIAETERTSEQQQKLVGYFRAIAPSLATTRKEIDEITSARIKLHASIPTTLVTKSVEPRVVRVLARGNWMDESGDVVSPAIPAVLGRIEGTSPNRLTRLDLANWLVSDTNTLTSRAFANRLWKLFFGAGLATNLGDLGSQGDWPSHPELLDWLASELVRSGWDVKHLAKTMVMSQTYRQSSDVSAVAAESDPYNRWLSHQGRWRLEAETVRDVILFTSGLLNDEIGGPSVKPFQPMGYWAYLNFPQREWQSGTGNELYRRGLYTHWQRQYLHPSLAAFDAPSREECVVDRPRSNTPLQALALLNDPSYVESARALAARVLIDGGTTDRERINRAIAIVLTRPVRDGEADVLLSLLAAHRQSFLVDEASSQKFTKVGPFQPTETVDPAELSAWTSVARVLLNLHETITRN